MMAVKNHVLRDNPLRQITAGKFSLTLAALLPVYGLALAVAKRVGKHGLEPANMFTGDILFLALGGLILYFVATRPFGISVVSRLRDGEKEPISSLFVMGVGCYLLNVAAVLAILLFLILPLCLIFKYQLPDSASELSQLIVQVFQHGSLSQKLALGLDVCLLTPLIEETVCRGFLYQWLRTRMKIMPALLVSALFFAVMHMDPGSMLVFIPVGLTTAIAFELSGSLFSAFLTHSLWNLTAIALTVYSASQTGT